MIWFGRRSLKVMLIYNLGTPESRVKNAKKQINATLLSEQVPLKLVVLNSSINIWRQSQSPDHKWCCHRSYF